MMSRYVASMPPGIVVTAGLLFLMQKLIVTESIDLPPDPPQIYSLPAALPPPVTRTREPEPPDRIPLPTTLPTGNWSLPPVPDEPMRSKHVTRPVPVTRNREVIGIPMESERPLIAIVRVQPQYPPRLAAMGIEGFAVVQFDVAADGRVHNVSVVNASDRRFHRAAVHAAGRFRYKPRIVDGEPVATYGVQTVFRFELEGGSGTE